NLRCFGNGQFLPGNLQDGIVGNTLGAAHLGTPIVRKPMDSSGGLMSGTYTSTRDAIFLLLCIMSPVGKLSSS
nr:hypothetical protein [Tanacetum cinerariifolium]